MNMSYAFENTYRDLRQCLDLLENGGPESQDELDSAKNLVELCQEISADYAEDIIRRASQSRKKVRK